MFESVSGNTNFPRLESEVGRFWREAGIYRKSLERRTDGPEFVFFEGPPTANGMPHPGHCLTRAIKDLFPRYRTMRGYHCERKAGWDTHGLPVEVEVCKELGIHSKEEIEAYGIEPFIQKCQQSVWRYMQEWERLTERLGFWVDLEAAYVTYHQSFVESVWWSLKQLFDRDLLYQGHKIVWWWAQGGTALSSGEVGQGYRQVADPSVYVRFPIVHNDQAEQLGLTSVAGAADASLLVWTTTPWTLPSNQFAAVHPELDYALVVVSPLAETPLSAGEKVDCDSKPGEGAPRLLIASALVETIAAKAKCQLTIQRTFKGSELIGLRYEPPFDYFYNKMDTWGDIWGIGGEVDLYERYEQDFLEWQRGAPCSWQPAWKIYEADFVTVDSGTGIVHIAPAFGEVDYDLWNRIQKSCTEKINNCVPCYLPDLLIAVGPDGKFTEEGPDYCQGRWVKECDKEIARDLKQRGLLFHQEQYLHDYPFCWRAEEDPLIQYPRRSWFIRTSQFKEAMLANNQQINWLPEHIKEGRFGNFLATNVDWALSRERYWGTPLPIWVCETTGQMEAVANYDALLAKPGVAGQEVWLAAKQQNPELVDDLRVHKPYIDAVTYDSPFSAGARMRRVSEVIDCWYDSGAMPFAQWGYPEAPQSRERFAERFPADFISEAIDQTRGWFYSQLAISTLLFGEQSASGGASAAPLGSATDTPATAYPHPFRNCIVLGLMLGEDGQKMSKSKRNYREPGEIFDRYGADALRWYFFANQPPWTSIRYNEQSIKESIPEFLLRLWNVYSFFVIYANIDGFDPAVELAQAGANPSDKLLATLDTQVFAAAPSYRPVEQRGELDRWILSLLHQTTAQVTERLDAYDNYAAAAALTAYVDALSNWYVRRSRDRFWSADPRDPQKLDAYWTLYECLVTTIKLIAPFTPFLAESIWQNLARAPFGDRVLESVHLADYPEADPRLIDAELACRMDLVRDIVSLGRNARTTAKLKVRQPLAKVEVVLADRSHQSWLEAHAGLIAEELNVKLVEFAQAADEYVNYTVLPDLKKLGPRLGKRLPALKAALASVDAAALLAALERDGRATVDLADGPLELTGDDVQVRLSAKEGWAAAHSAGAVVVLATELDERLVLEGLARELVHAIQVRRKEIGCEYTDRIEVTVACESEQLRAAATEFASYIAEETLAQQVTAALPADAPGADNQASADGEAPAQLEVGGVSLWLSVRKLS